MTRRYLLSLGALLVGSLVVSACGPADDKNSQRREIDNQTVVDELNVNAREMSRATSDSVRFLEQSDLALHTVDFANGSCGSSSDPCQDPEPEIDTGLEQHTNDGLDALEKAIFSSDNITNQTETTITYKMDAEYYCGDVSCATFEGGTYRCRWDDQPPSQQELTQACTSNVREMNYRVRVWSPSDGKLNFSLRVGPGHKPFDVKVHPDRVSMTGRLGEIKKAVRHGDMVYDTASAEDIPDTFKGEIQTVLEKQSDRKLHFETLVKSDVSVGGGDVQFQLASASKPIFGATADGVAEQISTTFDLPEIELSFPASHYDYEDNKDVSFQHMVQLAGLTGRIIMKGGSETLEINDISFGDSTSWLKMDGSKVVSLDLNADSGRSFDMTVKPGPSEDVFDADISPEIDASIAVNFRHIQQKMDWVAEWLKDDQFDISLTGSSPSVRAGTSQNETGFLEVLNGTLELKSSTPEYTRTVSPGSCLVSQVPSGSGKVSYYHPLEELRSGSCPQ